MLTVEIMKNSDKEGESRGVDMWKRTRQTEITVLGRNSTRNEVQLDIFKVQVEVT
jgi:hypothetical protein